MTIRINVTEGKGPNLRKGRGLTVDEALTRGFSQEAVGAAEEAEFARIGREAIRSRIASNAGDTLSLLGTTSDAATIAVLVSACFMASLDEKTSYGAFRAKANGFMQAISGDHDPTEIAAAFMSKVASGKLRLPALEKGIVEVLAEVTDRGNAVAEAINPSAPAEA